LLTLFILTFYVIIKIIYREKRFELTTVYDGERVRYLHWITRYQEIPESG